MASGSSHDLRHQRRRLCQVYLEEHADSSGKVVKTERTWFYDYRALDSISPNIRWPLERITDDAACAPRDVRHKIWTSLRSACSKIGTRTLTTLIFEFTGGPLFREAEDIVS